MYLEEATFIREYDETEIMIDVNSIIWTQW